MFINIYVLRASETVMFAASELARYLRLVSNSPVAFQIRAATRPVADGITLGVCGDGFSQAAVRGLEASAEDDAIRVDVQNGVGTIAGANERSVLLGVYRFLHQLGCRWVRPGPEGEYLPRVDLTKITVKLDEKASLRHRVICIEGAVSVENVLAMVDWAPKVGYSGYFMQFSDGYAFYARWYQHMGDTGKEPEPFSPEAARAFTIAVEQEIKKRSLVYHAVGHSWTCRALGMELSHWTPYYPTLTKDEWTMLAEVEGQRGFRWDRPMLTSLCFSRREVRQRMVKAITSYAVRHPEVDLLHVWIDDGANNKCSCARCREFLPADLYVKMLKELEAAFHAAGCNPRVVFIGYSDLLWPPRPGAAPLDQKRFAFVYANSRRDYSRALQAAKGDEPIPPFVMNKNAREWSDASFHAYLNGWRKYFSGDTMLFEYYLMSSTAQVLDPYALANVIHADVRNLKQFGLNGLLSCQLQRVFFPVGLPVYVLGQTLWQTSVDLDALRDDYFHAAFGADSAECKEFVKVAGERIAQVVRFGGTLELQPEAAAKLASLALMLRDFNLVVERNLHAPNPCHAKSWYYMKWYLRLLTRLHRLFTVLRTQGRAEVLAEWQTMRAAIAADEDRYQAVLDVNFFNSAFDNYIINGRFNTAPEAVVQ